MSGYVLDSSAILAILLGENGQDVAADLAKDALMCSVNLAEVVTKCIEYAYPEDIALQYVRDSNIEIVTFNAELAILAGRLRNNSGKGVLSLGDRACIATAARHRGTAVTADRIWSTLDLGCQIALIR